MSAFERAISSRFPSTHFNNFPQSNSSFSRFNSNLRNLAFSPFSPLQTFPSNHLYGVDKLLVNFNASSNWGTNPIGTGARYLSSGDSSFWSSTAAGTSRPNSPIVLEAFNNYPAFRWTSNALLTFSFPLPINNNFCIAVVAQMTALNGLNIIISDNLSLGRGLIFLNPISISNNVINISSTISDFLPHIITATPNALCVDGVIVATGSIPSFPALRAIGHSGSGRNNIGNWSEIVIWNNLLSNTNLIQLNKTINLKYNIY